MSGAALLLHAASPLAALLETPSPVPLPYGQRGSKTLLRCGAEALANKVELMEARQGIPYVGRLALGHEWRLASAAAHARSWPVHDVRATEREPLPSGGEIRRMSASLPEFVQSLWIGQVDDQRGMAPVGTSTTTQTLTLRNPAA